MSVALSSFATLSKLIWLKGPCVFAGGVVVTAGARAYGAAAAAPIGSRGAVDGRSGGEPAGRRRDPKTGRRAGELEKGQQVRFSSLFNRHVMFLFSNFFIFVCLTLCGRSTEPTRVTSPLAVGRREERMV